MGSSINFTLGRRSIWQLSVRPRNILSTFHAVAGHSINFCCLFILLEDLPSPYVNISCDRRTFTQLPSTLCAAAGLSMNFRQHSVLLLLELPSLFVNISCGRRMIRCLSRLPVYLPSTSVNIPCCQEPSVSFCHLSVQSGNFHQHSVRPLDILSTSVTCPCSWGTSNQLSTWRRNFRQLCTAAGSSVNFRRISVQPGTIRQL